MASSGGYQGAGLGGPPPAGMPSFSNDRQGAPDGFSQAPLPAGTSSSSYGGQAAPGGFAQTPVPAGFHTSYGGQAAPRGFSQPPPPVNIMTPSFGGQAAPGGSAQPSPPTRMAPPTFGGQAASGSYVQPPLPGTIAPPSRGGQTVPGSSAQPPPPVRMPPPPFGGQAAAGGPIQPAPDGILSPAVHALGTGGLNQSISNMSIGTAPPRGNATSVGYGNANLGRVDSGPGAGGMHMPVPPTATPPVPSKSRAPPVPFGGGASGRGSMDGPHRGPIMPQHGSSQAQGNKIDPSQIPHPIVSATNESISHETRQLGAAAMPPGSTTCFVSMDRGNANPRFMRSTLMQIPVSHELLSQLQIPLAVCIQPLSKLKAQEDPVRIVDYGNEGPVRCGRCQGYMNPFAKFIDAGRRYECALCGFVNDVPQWFFCNLGPGGYRTDLWERPELCHGSVEFAATKVYSVREPMCPTFLFVVDVSYTAMASGATVAAIAAVRSALARIPANHRTLAGIITFDRTVHFYDCSDNNTHPRMVIMADTMDIFNPFNSGIVTPLIKSRAQIENILDHIPKLFGETKVGDCCLGAVLKSAVAVLAGKSGKVFCFTSQTATTGIGHLRPREDQLALGTDQEATMWTTTRDKDASLAYKGLSKSCLEELVSIDLYAMTSSQNIDLATISPACTAAGGQVKIYTPFDPSSGQGAQLIEDVCESISHVAGWESVMRVRCSQGLNVGEYIGNFAKKNKTDVEISAVDSRSSYCVALNYDDKLTEGTEALIQCAVLYTTNEGQRRIRVHNLSIPITTTISGCFRNADLDAIYSFLAKRAVSRMMKHTLNHVREAMITESVNMLYAYRKYCSTSASAVQLILPESLKLLPLYILSLIKSPALRSQGIKSDERVVWMSAVMAFNPRDQVLLSCNRLYKLDEGHDVIVDSTSNSSDIPGTLFLSTEQLDPDGIFLLEGARGDLALWLGRSCSSDKVKSVLGVRSVEDIVAEMNDSATGGVFNLFLVERPAAGETRSLARERLCNLIDMLQTEDRGNGGVRIVIPGTISEQAFLACLVEDKGPGPASMSYVEFLCVVHRQIQQRYSADK